MSLLITQIVSNITVGSVSSIVPVSLENRLTIRPLQRRKKLRMNRETIIFDETHRQDFDQRMKWVHEERR